MVQSSAAPPIRRRQPVVRTSSLMNAAAAHRGIGSRITQLSKLPGSTTQLQVAHDAAIRVVTVLVLWATMWFTRHFIMTDPLFPVEALLPAVYFGGFMFLNRDDLRVLRLPFLVDATIATFASAIIVDTALADVLLPALTLTFGLEWARIRTGFAVAVGLSYLGYYAIFGTPTTVPRHPAAQVAAVTAIGFVVALLVRSTHLLIGARTAAHHRTLTVLTKVKSVAMSSRVIAAVVKVFAAVGSVLSSPAARGMLVWLAAMGVDWKYRVSIGGLVTSACLLIGFGASLAPDRASGVSTRTRYLYGVLLIVAVWACDVSVFLAVPSYALPFVSNCVLSAYCILHLSTSPVQLPRVSTTASSGAVEITPAPAPQGTSVLGALVLWVVIVLLDARVQIHLQWEEPSIGRIVVAVNTIGYGILLLTSSFLDAFSRDARIRARTSYLAEEAISADAIALRQLVDDFEGVPDFDHALAAAGIRGDIKDVLMDARFLSSQAHPGLVLGHNSFDKELDDAGPVTPPSGETGTGAAAPTADSDESHSDASTTAHGSSTPAAPVVETKAASRSPDQPSPAGSFSQAPAAPAAAQPAPRESPEEIAAREKARQESDEARRKAKLAQKAEEKRLQDLRAIESAQRRERQRREQELSNISAHEKSARDVLVSQERSVRDRVSSDFSSEIDALHAAVLARRQHEAAKKQRSPAPAAATPATATAAAAPPTTVTAPASTPAPKTAAVKTVLAAPPTEAPKAAPAAKASAKASPPAEAKATTPAAPAAQPAVPAKTTTAAASGKKSNTKEDKPIQKPSAAATAAPAAPAQTAQAKDKASARGWEASSKNAAPAAAQPPQTAPSVKAAETSKPTKLPEPKSARQTAPPATSTPPPQDGQAKTRTPTAQPARVTPLLASAAQPSQPTPFEAGDEEGDAVNLLLAALHRNINNQSTGAIPTSTTSSKSATAFSPVASTPAQTSFAAGAVASENSKVADDDDGEDLMSFINDQVNSVLKDDDAGRPSARRAQHAQLGNELDFSHLGAHGINPTAPSFQSSNPASISPTSTSPMRGALPQTPYATAAVPTVQQQRVAMMEPNNFASPSMQPQYVAMQPMQAAYSPQYVFVNPNGTPTAAPAQQMMYVQYVQYGGQMVPAAYYVMPTQGVMPTQQPQGPQQQLGMEQPQQQQPQP